MLEACKESKVCIDIEQYIFCADEIGNEFIKVFEQKAKEGVKVRMLIDMAGSSKFYFSDIPEKLRKSGVDVRFYNIISPWRMHNLSSWFFRNHKKTLVIDEKIAFTGGVGVGYYMMDWRDTAARIDGTAVAEISVSFERIWRIAHNKTRVFERRSYSLDTLNREFITNAPYFGKRFLYHTFIDALRNAKTSISITTPYLLPDRRLIRVLKLAVKRGVNVKILVPEKNDVLIVRLGSEALLGTLLRSGIKVFKYNTHVLHAKTAIVDDSWATFGSFNLDSLSFVYNHEGNIITADPKCIAELKSHFTFDLTNSTEVTYSVWHERPFIQKVLELCVLPIRGFL